jgi:hypothetical protein
MNAIQLGDENNHMILGIMKKSTLDYLSKYEDSNRGATCAASPFPRENHYGLRESTIICLVSNLNFTLVDRYADTFRFLELFLIVKDHQ